MRRETRQKRAIRQALEQSADFQSAQDIHRALTDRGNKVGLTTVYRVLTEFVANGLVDQLLAQDGETVYRSCSLAHHHHLICLSCGATVEIELPGLEQATQAAAERHGFSEVRHNLEIFGECRVCATNPGLARGAKADLNLGG